MYLIWGASPAPRGSSQASDQTRATAATRRVLAREAPRSPSELSPSSPSGECPVSAPAPGRVGTLLKVWPLRPGVRGGPRVVPLPSSPRPQARARAGPCGVGNRPNGNEGTRQPHVGNPRPPRVCGTCRLVLTQLSQATVGSGAGKKLHV